MSVKSLGMILRQSIFKGNVMKITYKYFLHKACFNMLFSSTRLRQMIMCAKKLHLESL